MVPRKSPQRTACTGGDAWSEAQGPLRLLWDNREHSPTATVPLAGYTGLEVLAESAQPRAWQYAMGTDASAIAVLVPSPGAGGALCLCEAMLLKNRMREICSYGSVGESAGNRRLYPEKMVIGYRPRL